MPEEAKKSYDRGYFEGQVLQQLKDIIVSIDTYKTESAERGRKVEKELGDLDVRLQKMEQWKSWMLGAMAASSAGGGAVGAVLSKLLA